MGQRRPRLPYRHGARLTQILPNAELVPIADSYDQFRHIWQDTQAVQYIAAN
jgi:hypothetical protein